MSDPTVTFRDTLRRLSPPWLRIGNAEKYLYAIGLQLDAFADALVAGVKLRFPGYYSYESLSLIGRERRIRRGLYETDVVYASRLNRWLTDHRRRGGPYALLAQLYAFYAPNNFPIELFYRSGRHFSMDTAGNVTRDIQTWTFNSDPPEKWAQWLLVFHWPTSVAASGTWDGEPTTLWDDPTSVWDSDLTTDMVEYLRLIPKEWNAAHTIGTVQLIDPSNNTIHFSVG